jgi:iron-sulfur cluster assembly protein
MFEVTEEASEKIKQFVEGREGLQAIRVLMTDGGWRGPYLVMALDEQKENDEVFTEKGAKFVIEKALFERVKPIRIGYTYSTLGSGYTLDSELMKDMKGVSVGCHDIFNNCQTACAESGPTNSGDTTLTSS